jgi:hypothetical protein
VWWFVIAFALLEFAALAFLIYLGKVRRRLWSRGPSQSPVAVALHRDPKWVQREIERLCAGQDPSESLIKQMSAEDRALFEVSVIDALNNRTREGQHFLRSALIKYGYDEHCARRLMSAELSDRVRATALLSLLRPQSQEDSTDVDHRPNRDAIPRALAASRSTGPTERE